MFGSSNGTVYYSDPAYNLLLGSGEKLVTQAISENPSGTAPTIKVEVDQSNDNRNWVTKTSVPINAWTPSTSTVDTTFGNDTGPNGSFVRLKITVTTASTNTRLRLIVCGRGEQGSL